MHDIQAILKKGPVCGRIGLVKVPLAINELSIQFANRHELTHQKLATGAITTDALTQPHHVIRLPKSSSLVKFQDVEAKVKGSERSATTRFLITFNEKDEDTKSKAAEKVGPGWWHLMRKNERCLGVGCFEELCCLWCLDSKLIIETGSRHI